MPIVLFSRPILKRYRKSFITLKVSGLIFILIIKSESACLIYLVNTIKVVRGSYGLMYRKRMQSIFDNYRPITAQDTDLINERFIY